MFKNRYLLNLLLISILFAGVLSLISCGTGPGTGDGEQEAAFDFKISVPADTTYDFAGPVADAAVFHEDYEVQVLNGAGQPVNGVKVKILAHGSGIWGFYTDNTFSTPIAEYPFYRVTDEFGKIYVNYIAGPFTSITEDVAYEYGFRAQSGAAPEAVHTDTVNVPAVPTTTTPAALAISTASPLPGGTVGSSYAATLAATGGTPPYTWAVTSGTLPAGLTLTGNVIDGIPTTAGTYIFNVTVTDSAGASTPKTFTITIAPVPLAISTASPLPSGTVATTYSGTLTATGGTSPYTWAVTSGTVPSGLTVNLDGTITGTPTTAGLYAFTVTVTDSAVPPVSVSKNFQITIN